VRLEKLRTEADYFDNNKERMCYPKFRAQHLFIGSGVIEAGSKTIILACISHTLSAATRDKAASTSLRSITVLDVRQVRLRALTFARLVYTAFSRLSRRKSVRNAG